MHISILKLNVLARDANTDSREKLNADNNITKE